MTTTYYVSYRIRKSNGVRVDYASKDFDTESEARTYKQTFVEVSKNYFAMKEELV